MRSRSERAVAAMIRLRLAEFPSDRERILEVRYAVFVEEQGVPLEVEVDETDARCVHVLAFSDESAVGTARIDFDHAGKLGRLAVVRPLRGHGIGRALTERLHAIARERGLDEVWCNAQIAAQPFYEKLGYVATGEIFIEAGIEHVRMTCRLS